MSTFTPNQFTGSMTPAIPALPTVSTVVTTSSVPPPTFNPATTATFTQFTPNFNAPTQSFTPFTPNFNAPTQSFTPMFTAPTNVIAPPTTVTFAPQTFTPAIPTIVNQGAQFGGLTMPANANSPIQAPTTSINKRGKGKGKGSKSHIEPVQGYNVLLPTAEQLAKALNENIERPKYKSPVVHMKKRIPRNVTMLYTVVVNVLRMLSIRGYEIPAELDQIKNMSAPQFIAMYSSIVEEFNKAHPGKKTIRKALSGTFRNAQDNSFVYIYYPETSDGPQSTSNIEIKYVADILEPLLTTDRAVRQIIIIGELKLSPTGVTEFDKYKAFNFNFFRYDQLTYLPSEHYMTSKHILMTKAEIKSELTDNGVKLSDIKMIAYDDPVVLERNFKIGSVLRIERRNRTYSHIAPTTFDYRRVVRRSVNPKM